MKFGIVVFPGTWSDRDCYYSVHNICERVVFMVTGKMEEMNISTY